MKARKAAKSFLNTGIGSLPSHSLTEVTPNEGYHGAYALFLSLLPETLTVGDLLPALQWVTSFIAQVSHTGSFKEKTLADAILFRAWKAFEEPSLTRPFVEHVFARLWQHGDLCRGTDYRARAASRYRPSIP